MRLGWTTGKYSTTYRAVKTIRVDGKNKTIIIKNFGSEKYIRETYQVEDAKAWAKEQVQKLSEAELSQTPSFEITLNAAADLEMDTQMTFNGGYLFLQTIYHQLGLDKICAAIRAKHHFDYNMNAILSRLLYTRILYPASKLSSYRDSQRFIEQTDIQPHQIYRALSILADESEYIQSTVFHNSQKISKRHTHVIYYDCTNFFFEIEQAEDDKQYGVSKENRPLPIVEMGLFMDADGIPLTFCIHPGNTNEQQTMIPLEKVLVEKFDLSKFVVCTDSGLSSNTNRCFNQYEDAKGSRDFITTQSIKKLKGKYRSFALETQGWLLAGGDPHTYYNINELDEEADLNKIYYKRCWMEEKTSITRNGAVEKVTLKQQLIISYSIKYRNYLRSIRNGQIERIKKAVDAGEKVVNRKRQNDPKRFIKMTHTTEEGEIANQSFCTIDQEAVAQEEMYDGFYAVCTSLCDKPETIIAVNKNRWEIEESFRIMKSEFQARPVYLKRSDRIIAHFITCFLSLVIYRYLERRLQNRYPCEQIIQTLQEMNFIKYPGKGYQPTYTRTALTDALHAAFGFCTSKQIIPTMTMKNICANSKISVV